jgi:hypothetical protein
MNRRLLTFLFACAGVIGSSIAAQPPVKASPAPGSTTEPTAVVTPVANVARDTSRAAKGMPTEITIQREVFDYDRSGRRDPYKSLMSSSDVRPLLSDLRLTAVAFDPDGNNSVAILRDSYSKQQYRIRVGQQLGRLRVAAIHQKTVQFSIEEFGFNRQETLALASDTTKVRNP